MNKIILFGAGENGKAALEKYGKEKVAFFCDNAKEKQGIKIDGIEVLSFSEMLKYHKQGYSIMITPAYNVFLVGQLEQEGVFDYLIYSNKEDFYPLKAEEERKEKYAYNNEILDQLLAESRKLDLLVSIEEFKELCTRVKYLNAEEKIDLHYRGIKEEGQFYGNIQTLMEYAEIPEKEMKYFPEVSHQSCFPMYTPAFQYKSAVIFPGKYFRKKIHERAPYVPVFSVGPYIHYAKGIYDEEKVQLEKKKNGRTLVAFLPHTIENIDRLYNRNQFIDSIEEHYKDGFESIFLCCYWADINDAIYEYALNKGIRIVSAGFRFDTMFDRRLKTILELADAVVCGDIGTFIAYSLHMGKPIGRLDISNNQTISDLEVQSELERTLQFSEEYRLYKTKFYQIFDKNLVCSNEQKMWMNALNGFDQIRNAKVIKQIFNVSKDIWTCCEGNLIKYPEAVREVYSEYNKKGEFDKMTLLKEAVGNYVS